MKRKILGLPIWLLLIVAVVVVFWKKLAPFAKKAKEQVTGLAGRLKTSATSTRVEKAIEESVTQSDENENV